jgi:hypothetical protein
LGIFSLKRFLYKIIIKCNDMMMNSFPWFFILLIFKRRHVEGEAIFNVE